MIDTIAVKGRISDHSILDTRQREVIDPDTGEVDHALIGTEFDLPGGVRLRVSQRNGEMWALMEQSVPKFLNGNNAHGVTLPEVFESISGWYVDASGVVRWLDGLPDLRVPRVDTPLDFDGVTDFDHLLDGLSRLHVARCRVNKRFADGPSGEIQTLARGVPRSWMVTAYNKHAEMLSQARRSWSPERQSDLHEQAARCQGRLRVEPSLRVPYLRLKGVLTVKDLNEQALADLRRSAFERARMGVPVGGAPHLHAVLRRLPATDPDNWKFWPSVMATLMAEAHGLPDPVCGKIAKRNRALARSWGISAADMSRVAGPAVMLDYQSGLLVEAA